MPTQIITEPTFEPVTLQEAKDHLRITHSLEDNLITLAITTARMMAESYTQRAICQKTIEHYRDNFGYVMELHYPIVSSVTSIKYDDIYGVEQTLASTEYDSYLINEPAMIVQAYGKTFPGTRDKLNAVRIRYVAGYANHGAVPSPIKSALLLLIGHLYENREELTTVKMEEMPLGSKALLNPYRLLSCF